MLIDITVRITPTMSQDAQGNEKKTLSGHLGTHFEVTNKEFPLEYTECQEILFDVSSVKGRNIDLSDITWSCTEKSVRRILYWLD